MSATKAALLAPEFDDRTLPQGGLVAAQSAGGRVIFNGRDVLIDRAGGVSFIIHGLGGRKVIAVSEIQAVRLRPARGRTRGYLQLVLAGGGKRRGGAAGDENSILFDASHQPDFARLADAIRRAVGEAHMPVLVSSPAEIDEVGRLRALHDGGVITPAEFAALAARRARPIGRAADKSAAPEPRLRRLRPSDVERRTAAEARQAFRARWTVEPERPPGE